MFLVQLGRSPKNILKIFRDNLVKIHRKSENFEKNFLVQVITWDLQNCTLKDFFKNLFTISNASYFSLENFEVSISFFREIDLFGFTSFLGLDFFNISGLLWGSGGFVVRLIGRWIWKGLKFVFFIFGPRQNWPFSVLKP